MKQVVVFLCDLVESLEVNTKTEGTILLADKKDWSGMSEGGRADEVHGKMLIEEHPEGSKLKEQKKTSSTQWRQGSFF